MTKGIVKGWFTPNPCFNNVGRNRWYYVLFCFKGSATQVVLPYGVVRVGSDVQPVT